MQERIRRDCGAGYHDLSRADNAAAAAAVAPPTLSRRHFAASRLASATVVSSSTLGVVLSQHYFCRRLAGEFIACGVGGQ